MQDGMGTPALPEPPSLPGDGVAPSDEVFAAHPTGLTLPNMPSSEADGVGDVAALYRESTRELHRRLEELQTLYRMSEALGRAVAPQDIFQEAIDGLVQAVRADRASVLLFEADGVMRFKAWRGLSDGYRAAEPL